MIIYKATCTITNKSYIGQTRRPFSERRQSHWDDRKRRNNALGAALKKYGRENFIWEIVEVCVSLEQLNSSEIAYIKKYNTLSPNGYNLTTGGEGSFTRSEETKLKISKSKTGVSVVHSATWKKGQRPSIKTEFKGIKVINLESGIIFDSIRDAAEAHSIIKSTLAWRLRHKTTKVFAYVNQ